jgi:release factor glutamine methyltransferase
VRPTIDQLEQLLDAGESTWLGLPLYVRRGVLVPRPETELCGRVALAAAPDEGLAVDVCCGAGNLAVALAVNRPGLTVHALDLEAASVALTRANAERHDVANRVLAAESDVYQALDPALAGTIDLVVCNPPYISQARLDGGLDTIAPDEPLSAFDGGPFGVNIQTRVIAGARDLLRPGGRLVMEFGERQERQVAALLKRARGFGQPVLHQDEDGVPRVVEARREEG